MTTGAVRHRPIALGASLATLSWLLTPLGAVGCQASEPSASPYATPVGGLRSEVAFAGTAQPITLDAEQYVVSTAAADRFALASLGRPVPILIASNEHAGVVRVAGHLRADIERVTKTAPLVIGEVPTSGSCVLVGTLGQSSFIDELVNSGKLDVSSIAGRWEASFVQSVDQPWPGVDRALVIVGSDKRGTIYGMFGLSEQIGVSPWYYWADVPTVERSELHALAGRHALGPPAVKYRGIFINDEAPALSGWVSAEFGGFNSKFYAKLFELMLRLRANYLWPAMWGKAFNLDDPLNAKLADEYGIVMGTSHHEPMMRNQDEWRRVGSGNWNYTTNQAALTAFWEEGIRRNGTRESIVTIGMRGDGDLALSPNPDIPLVQSIITAQRQSIANVTGKDPATVPQVWTLYKEVQDYYDQGLRAPDDVTTMLADDNFGNIRKLPKLGEPIPSGGFGVYYHFDYVGSPRNYKWLNTNSVPRVWEQMHLAQAYGANRIWLVNVGDLKLLELPTQFFLDYAWAPERLPIERLGEYLELFAIRQFGVSQAPAIAAILAKYTKFNARRKPELLAPETYSLVNYREGERIVADYNRLVEQAEAIGLTLAPEYQAAYEQLVQFPIQASANLNELYVTVARNRLYAKQGRAATNAVAARAQTLYDRDAELTRNYNTMAGGKWNHIADQTHIGYTNWQEPSENTMPAVTRIALPEAPALGIAIEGSENYWPSAAVAAALPEFSPVQLQPAQYLEIFNRGQGAFEYRIETGAPYVISSEPQGTVDSEKRIWIHVDWAQAPVGVTRVPISVFGPQGSRVDVAATLNNPADAHAITTPFVEVQGGIAMDAEQFSRKIEVEPIHWQVLPDLSRTNSGVTPFPVTAPPQTPGGASSRLEYDLHLFSSGQVRVTVQVAPTGQFVRTGLKYAVSFDDQTPKNFNIHGDSTDSTWQERVSNNVNATSTTHQLATAGDHVLKFWMIDPGIVLQKIIVETSGVRPSYLGPPTSRFEEPTAPSYAAVASAAGGASGAATAAGGISSAAGGGEALGGLEGTGGNGAAGAPNGALGGVAGVSGVRANVAGDGSSAASSAEGYRLGGGCNVVPRSTSLGAGLMALIAMAILRLSRAGRRVR